jgi:hypothetical protein
MIVVSDIEHDLAKLLPSLLMAEGWHDLLPK